MSRLLPGHDVKNIIFSNQEGVKMDLEFKLFPFNTDFQFRLSDEDQRLIDFPHDLELEKEEILKGKLQVLLSPPFTGVNLEEILPGRIDDWLFRGQGFNMAIKEKTIAIELNSPAKELLAKLKSQKKELEGDISKLCNDLSSQTTKRINAQTGLMTELRQTQNANYKEIIDVSAQHITSQLRGNIVSAAPPANTNYYPTGTPSYISPQLLPIQYESDLINLNYLIFNKQNQLQSTKFYIQQQEAILSSGPRNAKITYTFKIGQIVPDNFENNLKCIYDSRIKNCMSCPFLLGCNCLKSNTFISVYLTFLQRIHDTSDLARFAAKHDIDIDVPISGKYELLPLYEVPTNNENIEIKFQNVDGKLSQIIMVKGQAYGSSKKCLIPLSMFNYGFTSVPHIPAKLLNVDRIHKEGDAEIFFTDSLLYAAKAFSPLYSILSSYYGGQFGNIEIDFFPFRGRTVHYLIFEHSGGTLGQAIQQACFNSKQIRKMSNVKLDFKFLKKDDTGSNQYIIDKTMTDEEFSAMYEPESVSTEPVTAMEQTKQKNDETCKMLLGPLIAEGRYILMAGKKHTGKTKLAASIAASVASGKEMVKFLRPERGVRKDVLYLDMELGKNLFSDHTQKLIESIAGTALKNIPLHVEHMNGLGINIHTPKGVDAIKAKITPLVDRLKLIIIDNITAVSSGVGGSDNSGWNQYTFPYLSELTAKGITVIILAHIDKKKIRGGMQKYLSASDVIVIEKEKSRNANNSDDRNIIRLAIEPDIISDYPFKNNSISMSHDEHAAKLEWEFNDEYLREIFTSSKAADKSFANDAARWFNVSPKVIREWRNQYK